jgi:hypothetical protein
MWVGEVMDDMGMLDMVDMDDELVESTMRHKNGR